MHDQLIQYLPDTQVWRDIQEEAHAALAKHGPPTSNPMRAMTILLEELGEAAEQALKLTSKDPTEHCGQPQRDRLLLWRHELCQLAGYSLLAIQKIDSGGYNIEQTDN